MTTHTHLPPTVMHTWIQLCALSRDELSASSIDTSRLAALTGKSKATLNRHIALLKQCGLLDGHLPDQGLQTIHKPCQAENLPAATPDHRKYPPPTEITSYFPRRILGYISYDDDAETP